MRTITLNCSTSGFMYGTKLSKSEVEKLLDKAIHEYKPSKKDSE